MLADEQLPARRLEAYIWSCGDEECGCMIPVVELVEPNPADHRFVTRTRVWEGTFVTDHAAEFQERVRMLKELRRGARQNQVRLRKPKDAIWVEWSGWRAA